MGNQTQRKNKKSGIVFASLFALVTTVILVFSGFNGEISSSQSGFVVNILSSVLQFFGIILDSVQMDSFALFIRKFIGHFLIFTLDGVFAYLAIINLFVIRKKWLVILLSVGTTFFVAGSSEIIQLFASGRSGNLIDVSIDLFGGIIGVAIALLVTMPAKEKTDKLSASS